MSFTNIWDNTTPADGSVASQLGQDLRDFRLDAQQRMSALSGLDANKTNFNFESGFAGVLYFATDTAKIYQWQGVSWGLIGTYIPGTGQIALPGGSAGTPSLAFGTSTTTGIYADTPDVVEISVQGTKQIAFGSSGPDYFVIPQIDATVAALAQSDNSGKLVSTNFLASFVQSALKSSLGTPNGYIAFPKWLTGGTTQLLVKWGVTSCTSDPFTITFDTTVPFGAAPVVVGSADASSLRIKPSDVTATNFKAVNANGYDVGWIAIGHS